ncbi:MAG TPA: translation initiation factor IF-2 subunit beta [Candidatus Acidoferrum sp.]|nr:translation initiation factor IF-2 subunit beta [Candidatus Acidoferrum sp.]
MSDEEYMKLLDRAFSKAPNLASESSDFVIPKVDSLVQGNKTILRNLGVISDKARRDPKEIARYISKELGVPVSIEEQRLAISGKFQGSDLDKRIQRYFEVYVICKECHKPDTKLEGAGRGMFYLVCEACGSRYGVKNY